MSRSQLEQLIKMANQIALNFGENRNPQLAAERTREHLHKFWTRAMLEELTSYAAADGEGLSPTVIQSLQL